MNQAIWLKVLVLVALLVTGGAVWLASQVPDARPDPPPRPDTLSEAPQADEPDAAVHPVPPAPQGPPTPAVSAAEPEPAREPLAEAPQVDWLHPHYGLPDPADRAAVDAVLALSGTLDFSTFWQQIRPLATDDNAFAQYLVLAFRDFLTLSNETLKLGYVEEPYLNQQRGQRTSENWVHWLYADWRSTSTPNDERIRDAFNRALAGEAAAQTLLISRAGWFRARPELADNLDEMLSRLSDNAYLQLRNLPQLDSRVIASAGESDRTLDQLRQQLSQSRHPLSQWLAYQFGPSDRSSQAQRSDLLNLAQAGYMTALHEVRRLAISGQGRWTNRDETPIDMNDAISVYQGLEQAHPANPLVSVTLCELHLSAGDYQASWRYLQKFAYEDDWADEVEDYSCWAGNHEAYGDLMIERGVITRPQWQDHLDTIDGRRSRIRG